MGSDVFRRYATIVILRALSCPSLTCPYLALSKSGVTNATSYHVWFFAHDSVCSSVFDVLAGPGNLSAAHSS